MLDCREWNWPLNRCVGHFTAHWPRTFSVMSACRTISTKEEANPRFYRETWKGNGILEKIMDDFVRGKPECRYLRRNAKGTIDGVLREDPPEQGANVFLTLDARLPAIPENHAARRTPRRCGSCRSKQWQHTGDGFCAIIRAEHFHPEHQGERLDSAAERRGRSSSSTVRSAACPARLDIQAHHVSCRSASTKNLANARYSCGGGVSYGDHFFQCWINKNVSSHGTIGLADAIKVHVTCCSRYWKPRQHSVD